MECWCLARKKITTASEYQHKATMRSLVWCAMGSKSIADVLDALHQSCTMGRFFSRLSCNGIASDSENNINQSAAIEVGQSMINWDMPPHHLVGQTIESQA